eukprot:scaffold3294_cov253-Pinguiococcus_pyrenoidosus.AAC.2
MAVKQGFPEPLSQGLPFVLGQLLRAEQHQAIPQSPVSGRDVCLEEGVEGRGLARGILVDVEPVFLLVRIKRRRTKRQASHHGEDGGNDDQRHCGVRQGRLVQVGLVESRRCEGLSPHCEQRAVVDRDAPSLILAGEVGKERAVPRCFCAILQPAGATDGRSGSPSFSPGPTIAVQVSLSTYFARDRSHCTHWYAVFWHCPVTVCTNPEHSNVKSCPLGQRCSSVTFSSTSHEKPKLSDLETSAKDVPGKISWTVLSSSAKLPNGSGELSTTEKRTGLVAVVLLCLVPSFSASSWLVLLSAKTAKVSLYSAEVARNTSPSARFSCASPAAEMEVAPLRSTGSSLPSSNLKSAKLDSNSLKVRTTGASSAIRPPASTFCSVSTTSCTLSPTEALLLAFERIHGIWRRRRRDVIRHALVELQRAVDYVVADEDLGALLQLPRAPAPGLQCTSFACANDGGQHRGCRFKIPLVGHHEGVGTLKEIQTRHLQQLSHDNVHLRLRCQACCRAQKLEASGDVSRISLVEKRQCILDRNVQIPQRNTHVRRDAYFRAEEVGDAD